MDHEEMQAGQTQTGILTASPPSKIPCRSVWPNFETGSKAFAGWVGLGHVGWDGLQAPDFEQSWDERRAH